jgi:hypothetical protein
VGFEPTRACALPVFKTGAINHSTTPPSFRLGELCHREFVQQETSGDVVADIAGREKSGQPESRDATAPEDRGHSVIGRIFRSTGKHVQMNVFL